EAEDDLLGRRLRVLRCFVEATDRSRETGDRAAAAETVAFDHDNAQSLTGGGRRGRHARRSRTDDQHVAIEPGGGTHILCLDGHVMSSLRWHQRAPSTAPLDKG